jgi:threonine/homoserine/homoserine lactone efflux protein
LAQTAFLVVRYAGVLYLFLGTLALTLGNPKTMLFFLALLPLVVPLEALRPADYLEIVAAITVILPLVLGAYALAATRARQFFRRPKSVRLMNRCAGIAMAGAAIVIATRDT